MAHYRGPHVVEFIIGGASRDPLAHAGYLLTSRAAASVSDCFFCPPFRCSRPSPIFPRWRCQCDVRCFLLR